MECRDAPAERPRPAPGQALSRSLVALDQNSTIIAVVELSQSSWLVGGMLPGIERQPCKKLEPSPEQLLAVLHRWQDEAVRAGRTITRIAVAFEAGRDGFWLARWLEARGVEAHVIHASSVAVSREHRRAKTDRLDTELLKRGLLGWMRGERGQCSRARVPTIAEEEAKRPNPERECLVGERTRIVNRIKSRLARLGIRDFKPPLRKAAKRLATVHTPEGMPLPPNALAELQRDMARLGFVVSQIREIEDARQKRLEQQPETGASLAPRNRRGLVVIVMVVIVVELEHHEQIADRRAVHRHIGIVFVRNRIWKIVAAASAQRHQVPVALDEFQDRDVVGIAVRDMSSLRVGRHHHQRHARPVAEEIDRLDKAAVVIPASLIESNKQSRLRFEPRIGREGIQDFLQHAFEEIELGGCGTAVDQSVGLD